MKMLVFANVQKKQKKNLRSVRIFLLLQKDMAHRCIADHNGILNDSDHRNPIFPDL